MAHSRDFFPERGCAPHQALEARQLARRATHGRRAGLDRLEVVGKRQQSQRFQRAPLDVEERQQRLEILGRPQRKHRVGRQVAHRLRGGSQRLAHNSLIGGWHERAKARCSRRREREAAHGGDNTVEFEGFQAACGHVESDDAERSGGNR